MACQRPTCIGTKRARPIIYSILFYDRCAYVGFINEKLSQVVKPGTSDIKSTNLNSYKPKSHLFDNFLCNAHI
jgi:hypothetical protein